MSTIQITAQTENRELINVKLTSNEVAELYKLRKENQSKIAELEKNVSDLTSNKKYAEAVRDKVQCELTQAHTLLTALGIPDKTDHAESYYRKDLEITARIALYIAKEEK